MRNVRVVALVAIALATAVAGANAGNPRLEKKQLTSADNARAARALIRPSDLRAGWQQDKPSPFDQLTGVPGCDPNLSRFTVTGRAHSAFKHSAGASVESRVDLFKSTGDARGDFAASDTALTVRCMRAVFAKDLKGTGGRIVSARRVSGPKLGERTAGFRLVFSVPSSGKRVLVYVDFRAFQQDRAIGQIFASNPERTLARDAEVLLRLMALRARR